MTFEDLKFPFIAALGGVALIWLVIVPLHHAMRTPAERARDFVAESAEISRACNDELFGDFPECTRRIKELTARVRKDPIFRNAK